MKKNFSILLCIVIIFSWIIPIQAFAEPTPPFIPATGELWNSDGTDGKQKIPVYGYIGIDTPIIDPDPVDPDVPPNTEVYVQIPIKIMWAAFESDKLLTPSNIKSPSYKIINLSSQYPVKVSLKSFIQRSSPQVNLENKLTLKLHDLSAAEIFADNLIDLDGTPGTEKTIATSLAKKLANQPLQTDNKVDFKIGGAWTGEYTSKLWPTFDMTLLFEAIKP